MANWNTIYQGEVLGKRVDILFSHDDSAKEDTFYAGTIVEARSFLDAKGSVVAEHCIYFDDGDELWFNLRQQEQEHKLQWRNPLQKKTTFTKTRKMISSSVNQAGHIVDNKKATGGSGAKRHAIVEGFPQFMTPVKKLKAEGDDDTHGAKWQDDFSDDNDDASFVSAREYFL